MPPLPIATARRAATTPEPPPPPRRAAALPIVTSVQIVAASPGSTGRMVGAAPGCSVPSSSEAFRQLVQLVWPGVMAYAPAAHDLQVWLLVARVAELAVPFGQRVHATAPLPSLHRATSL